jgi:hypothetical protein
MLCADYPLEYNFGLSVKEIWRLEEVMASQDYIDNEACSVLAAMIQEYTPGLQLFVMPMVDTAFYGMRFLKRDYDERNN